VGILGRKGWMLVLGEMTAAAQRKIIKIVGWSALGIGVVAGALWAGYEIRLRRLIKRRTPYEMFSHSGDAGEWTDDTEYGVGV